MLLAFGRCMHDVMSTAGDWTELALLTGKAKEIEGHARLLRSLYFGDDDYEGNVLDMVPVVLGRVPDPKPDPWADLGAKAAPPKPLTLRDRFPNLDTVTEYLKLPAWLQEHHPDLLEKLFWDASDVDATLPDGTVLSSAEAAAARLEVGEMRRQIERIRRDHATDPEAAVGQAKDLIETACRTILGHTGDAGKEDLPKLISRTMKHLGIDPSQVDEGGDPVEARSAKRLFGGLASVLNGAGELRNARGTGHGRSKSHLLDDALGRLTVGLVLPAVVYLIEVYEDRTNNDQAPNFVSKESRLTATHATAGTRVVHTTFGKGTIVDVVMSDGKLDTAVASIDFGREVGVKRLLLRYAPLALHP